MTSIGIEYLKTQNQRSANDETARANRANESIKWAGLAEDQRYHNLQRQTSLDTAAMQQAASMYNTDRSYEASKYSTDQNLKKGTLMGAYDGGQGIIPGIINAAGFLWDTLL